MRFFRPSLLFLTLCCFALLTMLSVPWALAQVAPATPTASDGGMFWQVTDGVLRIVGPALAIVLTALAALLVRTFQQKTHATVTDRQMAMIDTWVDEAVRWVEEQVHKRAKAGAGKPGPESKLEMGVRYVLDLVEAAGIPGWTAQKVQQKIEAALQHERVVNRSRSSLAEAFGMGPDAAVAAANDPTSQPLRNLLGDPVGRSIVKEAYRVAEARAESLSDKAP